MNQKARGEFMASNNILKYSVFLSGLSCLHPCQRWPLSTLNSHSPNSQGFQKRESLFQDSSQSPKRGFCWSGWYYVPICELITAARVRRMLSFTMQQLSVLYKKGLEWVPPNHTDWEWWGGVKWSEESASRKARVVEKKTAC